MAQRKITQARAHETRARILTGAAEAFADHGFAGATIADIMTRSGVTKRALYFHSDTKEEVADAVLAAHTTWLRDAVAALAGSPVQRLVDYGYLTCDGLVDDPIFPGDGSARDRARDLRRGASGVVRGVAGDDPRHARRGRRCGVPQYRGRHGRRGAHAQCDRPRAAPVSTRE
ncbi:TetR/AcrR family transcriptional regulator [Dermacoccus nishinomiyaensis]|uniref:TetR/AcrR family transcriptional regulator n=1 Tax=Dermacoccus nishinomiyaensis TaxID=1274 RepID=UPI0010AD5274|nr:TetR/AcrR family transcriptional regulator [Dermacoccus nishinomiyaensis]TJZ95011.1 TetR/AcrR family transcriptional regulator [Dermacoccus nishinomiyaensis]